MPGTGPFEGPEAVGGIAPYHYGTQSAGDRFNVFVKKDEPFPTENPQWQTFFTRTPNARMISIPVYGGENLDKASLNEQQGEAFAILPSGLPQETPVRVKLWLDEDGIFKVAAQLQDGTDLRPWIVKGEQDAKAIEAVQKAEQMLAGKGAAVSPKEQEEIENAKNQVFDDMRQGNFGKAQEHVEKLQALAEGAGQDDSESSLQTQAQNLIGFTQFVLHEYSWALDPNQTYRLNTLVGELIKVLESGNKKTLPEKVKALGEATDNFPDAVKIFLGLRGAIQGRIHQIDPVLAMSLMEDLDEVETAFKERNVAAPTKLNTLAARVTKAIEDVSKRGGVRCSNGHTVPAGERYCPSCGDDMQQLNWKGSVSSSTGAFRNK
jgi:hypothetical protein